MNTHTKQRTEAYLLWNKFVVVWPKSTSREVNSIAKETMRQLNENFFICKKYFSQVDLRLNQKFWLFVTVFGINDDKCCNPFFHRLGCRQKISCNFCNVFLPWKSFGAQKKNAVKLHYLEIVCCKLCKHLATVSSNAALAAFWFNSVLNCRITIYKPTNHQHKTWTSAQTLVVLIIGSYVIFISVRNLTLIRKTSENELALVVRDFHSLRSLVSMSERSLWDGEQKIATLKSQKQKGTGKFFLWGFSFMKKIC